MRGRLVRLDSQSHFWMLRRKWSRGAADARAGDFPGVQLYSLQKGPPEKELLAVELRRPIIDLAAELNDFADTAAVVANLDLVIMTDSAVAHLAGGPGVPVWWPFGALAVAARARR
ncbi:hypothetical protein AB7M17_005190 [Bradyrhizobium sp. USDA 377]